MRISIPCRGLGLKLIVVTGCLLAMLVFFQRTTFWRILAGAMFAITLPYYFLAGTRSAFLVVTLPFIVTYLFYGRHLLILKLAVLAVAFFCLKEGFKFVQVFRISGFREVLAVKNPYELMDEDVQTVGLNMRGVQLARPDRLPYAARIAAGGIVALAIASPQVVAFAQYLPHDCDQL